MSEAEKVAPAASTQKMPRVVGRSSIGFSIALLFRPQPKNFGNYLLADVFNVVAEMDVLAHSERHKLLR